MILSTYPITESRTRTDEQTSANGAPNSDHVEVAGLHSGIEIADGSFSAFERLGSESIASPEV